MPSHADPSALNRPLSLVSPRALPRSRRARAPIGTALLIGLLAALLGGCAASGGLFGDDGAGDAVGQDRDAPSGEQRGVLARLADVANPTPAPSVYDVAFFGLERAPWLEAALERASETVAARRGARPTRMALERRARLDEERLVRALKSEGFFKGAVAAALTDDGALVRFDVTPGPRFTVAEHRFIVRAPSGSVAPVDVALPSARVDAPARSADILEAEDAALAVVAASGRPYARVADRDAVANFDTNTLRVETRIETGPYLTIAGVDVVGADHVAESFVVRFFEPLVGGPADPGAIMAAERLLARSRLFRFAEAALPAVAPSEDGSVILVVTVVEAAPRSVGAGVLYNTTDGPGVRGFWSHRTLFGAGERFRFETEVAQRRQSVSAVLRRPDYRALDRAMTFAIEVEHEDSEAFERFGVEGSVTIERRLAPGVLGSVGVLFEIAELDEGEGRDQSYLVGLPIALTHDASDDPLDPTRGFRLRSVTTPYIGRFNDEPLAFVTQEFGGSAYQPFGADDRFVLAARARVEVVVGSEFEAIPNNRRAFSGGGGTVRAFARHTIGPLDGDDDPTGGLTAFDASVELRARVTETFSLAPFVDVGVVSQERFDLPFSELQTGVGLGFRYATPIGPLRLDVAVPIDRRDVDDPVQVYLSIGQAF